MGKYFFLQVKLVDHITFAISSQTRMGWMVNAHGVYCKKSNDGQAEGDEKEGFREKRK